MKFQHILYAKESKAGKIEVANAYYRKKNVRLLLVNGAIESAMVRDPGCQHELVFPYMKAFDDVMFLRQNIQSVYLLGGGGFAYPRHFFNRFPDKKMDVAEISQDMIDVSRRYFGLDALLEREEKRFRLYMGDGFSILFRNRKKYDMIIQDAFVGSKPRKVQKKEAVLVREHLSPDGIYCINVVTALSGLFRGRGERLKKTISSVFPYVMLMAAEPDRRPGEQQNCLLIASMKEL